MKPKSVIGQLGLKDPIFMPRRQYSTVREQKNQTVVTCHVVGHVHLIYKGDH